MPTSINLETPDELEERLYAVLGRAEKCRDGRTHLDLRGGLDHLLTAGRCTSPAKQRPRSACFNPVREHYSQLVASHSRMILPSRSHSPPPRLPGGSRQPGNALGPASSPRTPRRGPSKDFMARYHARKAAERQAMSVHRLVDELEDGLQHDELLCISRSPSPGAIAAGTPSGGYCLNATATTPRRTASRSPPPALGTRRTSMAAVSPSAEAVAAASPRVASPTPFANAERVPSSSSFGRHSGSLSPLGGGEASARSSLSHSVSSVAACNASVTTAAATPPSSSTAVTTRASSGTTQSRQMTRGDRSYSSQSESVAARRSLDQFMNDVRSSRSFDTGAGHTRQTAYPTDAAELEFQVAEQADDEDVLMSIRSLTHGIREQMQLLTGKG